MRDSSATVLACGAKAAILAFLLLPGSGAAAQLKRQVYFGPDSKIMPVVVEKVTLGSAVVQFGRYQTTEVRPYPVTPFSADDDWISQLTVYLLNRTEKAVVRLTVVFSFPETTLRTPDGPSRAGFSLTLGLLPPPANVDPAGRPIPQRPGAKPISLGPGQTMSIRLSDYIDEIKRDGERSISLSAATQLNVTVQPGIYFADGMQWNGGYRTFDEQTGTWQRMPSDFFPGDPDAHWPNRPGWVQ
jgi:hypothetical protein